MSQTVEQNEQNNQGQSKENLDNKEKSGYDKSWLWTLIAIILFGIIIIVWYLYGLYIDKVSAFMNIKTTDLSKRGTFGDMYGALNALFAGLAFFGVIVAIFLQRRELKLQREELKDTREVLKMTQETHEEQMKTLKLQQFENTFFQILKIISDEIHLLISSTSHTIDTFMAHMKPKKQNVVGIDKLNNVEQVIINAEDYFKNNIIASFICEKYTLIISYIKDNCVTDELTYIKIFRTTIHYTVKRILFYYILTNKGAYFKEFVINFQLFKGLHENHLADPSHKFWLPPKAYGESPSEVTGTQSSG